ncbi:MAG: universal stress protein UspA [Bacteroidetes bacterium]|nr:MAG: universal stress protein UspA [Bacteroidota bacterium]
MKKILVPTDFSAQANFALHVASQLAKKHDCEIYLLHMLELPVNEIDALSTHSDLPEAMFYMKLARKRFDDVLEKPFLKNIKVHEIVKFHQAFDGIIDSCKEFKIDIIVMGSHGVSGFKEMFIGSNTEKVVRTSDIPVLVIKNYHKIFKVKNFIFASDFLEENKKPFKKAIKFAKLNNAALHLLMINTPSKFLTTDEADSRMQEFMKGSRFKNYTINIYNDYTIEKGILNFAHHIDAGLIGMSTHGRKGIAHFFNGSISEDLVNHAKRPVITFRI